MIALVFLAAVMAAEETTVPVREVTSEHFRVRTDLPDEEVEQLLTELETMIGHVSKYWARPLRSTIDMYVARDIDSWPQAVLDSMSPQGVTSIRNGAGVTLTQKVTRGAAWKSRSVVYAVSERGTAQHEAVHAYCGLVFGSTGPTWYAEGMAEVGQYWRADDPAAVHVHPYVIRHLKSDDPKPLKELVSLNQQTGDSWQNYASRWALCHLLGFNPNYSKRFHVLGMRMLTNRGTTFEEAFAPVAREIDFEYRLFLKHLCEGYRVDLCRWDWEGTPRPLRSRGRKVTVEAKRGWQAVPVLLKAGESYRIVAVGQWSVDDDTEVTADGAEDGRGQLVTAIFTDYELSEPIELGEDTTITADSDGQLVFRCRDGWEALADNEGEISVEITSVE